MQKYEMIREVYNLCSGNQMRDVSITEIETDDPEGYVRSNYDPRAVIVKSDVNGTLVFDVTVQEHREKVTFGKI